MLDKIVAQLKTGTIINVVPYGGSSLPEPPYIVVRPEKDTLNRGIIYRIFVHMNPNNQFDLIDYVNNDLSVLLTDFFSETRNGGHQTLFMENDFVDLTVSNDDGTISRERRFLMPSLLF